MTVFIHRPDAIATTTGYDYPKPDEPLKTTVKPAVTPAKPAPPKPTQAPTPKPTYLPPVADTTKFACSPAVASDPRCAKPTTPATKAP
jgi:hypothetical protein